MPFYDSRPPEGWPKGSINDMDYPLLGSICAVCCVFVAGSGIWMLYRLDLGMGYSCKPYKSGRAPEVNSLSGIICLLCGTMYAAKSFDFFDGGGTPFSLNWYWYLDYVFTCPLLILDFAFTLDLPHKIRYFFAVFLTLWCGVAAFVTPSAYRFAYYALGCCWFTPFALSLMRHVKERYLVYPPKCQRWLFWACVIFFGFWPMFPILFIFSWLGTGHISQQAFYIIHAFLDLTCKSIFGILMTVFRLELEEHTEVQGLPLNEPETLSLDIESAYGVKPSSSSVMPPPPGDTDPLAVYNANIKLQWIQKLLSEALAETSRIDLGNNALPSPKPVSLSYSRQSLSLRHRKQQGKAGDRPSDLPASSALSPPPSSPSQKDKGGERVGRERDMEGKEGSAAIALSGNTPAVPSVPSDCSSALRRASSRQRARASESSQHQEQDAIGAGTLRGEEARERRHRRSLSHSSSSVNHSLSCRSSPSPTREGRGGHRRRDIGEENGERDVERERLGENGLIGEGMQRSRYSPHKARERGGESDYQEGE